MQVAAVAAGVECACIAGTDALTHSAVHLAGACARSSAHAPCCSPPSGVCVCVYVCVCVCVYVCVCVCVQVPTHARSRTQVLADLVEAARTLPHDDSLQQSVLSVSCVYMCSCCMILRKHVYMCVCVCVCVCRMILRMHVCVSCLLFVRDSTSSL